MGIDISYQALPDKAPALRRAMEDDSYWEDFLFVIPAWESKNKEPYVSIRKSRKEIHELFLECPNLTYYAESLGRSYHVVNFLLNLQYYRENRCETFESKLVFGSESLSDHAKGTQGIGVRYSDSVFVKSAAKYFEELSIQKLADNFNATEMAALNLYKFSLDNTFDNYSSALEKLSSLYNKAAKSGYGMLYFLD